MYDRTTLPGRLAYRLEKACDDEGPDEQQAIWEEVTLVLRRFFMNEGADFAPIFRLIMANPDNDQAPSLFVAAVRYIAEQHPLMAAMMDFMVQASSLPDCIDQILV